MKLRFATVYGFRNIQTLTRKFKRAGQAKGYYHYVEVMSCPSGCSNGGGQIRAAVAGKAAANQLLADVTATYRHGATTTALAAAPEDGGVAEMEQEERAELAAPAVGLTRDGDDDGGGGNGDSEVEMTEKQDDGDDDYDGQGLLLAASKAAQGERLQRLEQSPPVFASPPPPPPPPPPPMLGAAAGDGVGVEALTDGARCVSCTTFAVLLLLLLLLLLRGL